MDPLSFLFDMGHVVWHKRVAFQHQTSGKPGASDGPIYLSQDPPTLCRAISSLASSNRSTPISACAAGCTEQDAVWRHEMTTMWLVSCFWQRCAEPYRMCRTRVKLLCCTTRYAKAWVYHCGVVSCMHGSLSSGGLKAYSGRTASGSGHKWTVQRQTVRVHLGDLRGLEATC